MEDKSLYRKYRPGTFDEVLGQEHIIKVLEGSIKLGKVAHSYIFFGSRGTGKTSVARIMAKELEVSAEDTFEIDAASNRGIDDIRELREGVRTLPFNSKYKIYIIDEAHMLTKEAWNALLKTLEEPPSHVIFILATTEIEKVPETIVSRCQVFTFKKPSIAVLKEMVSTVAKKEGFKIEKGGAELISVLGDGSFRDTHGILQKVLSFSKDKEISLSEIESVTSAPSRGMINELLSALVEKDVEGSLRVLRKVADQNADLSIFLKLFLNKLRLALLIRYAPELKNDIFEDLTEDDQEFISNLVKEKAGMITSKTLEAFLSAGEMMRFAAVKELPMELAIIKILKES